MALKRPNIHVNGGTWSSLIFFGLCDALKPVLFFLDAIPLVGLPVGYVFSTVLCIFEMTGGGLWLLLSGFFADDVVGMQNVLWYWSLFAANLIPVVDDLPFTAPAIFYRIITTKKADTKAMKKYEHAKKAEHEHHKAQQEHKKQRAASAAQNANMNRQQALNASIEAANDNHRN
jgi:hypothetical protein